MPSRRDNEHSAPPQPPSMDGSEQGNDSINLSWSVLNNASAISQRHATVPESVSGGGSTSDRTTNVNSSSITRSINSDNSEDDQDDDSASSKVIIMEHMQQKRGRSGTATRWTEDDDDSNRDDGVASSAGGGGAVDNDETPSVAAGDGVAAASEWTGQSVAFSPKGVAGESRNNRKTASSRHHSGDSSIRYNGDSAALTADKANELLLGDSQAANSANRNAISGDSGTATRSEVRRRSNDTMATNAKLIAEETKSERTFGHNNITRASPATTATAITIQPPASSADGAGLIPQVGERVVGDGSISSKTLLSTTSPSPPPQQHNRQSAVLVAGVGGGGGASRNKSSSGHNSIRALNHISDRKPYFGKHHHNNDK